MKNNSIIKFMLVAGVIISLASLNSCKKDSTNEVDTETQSVVDNSICEQEFMQIQPTTINLAVATKGTGAKKVDMTNIVLASCDTLTYISGDTTYTNLNNPPVFEFNFGTCSAANFDGVSRSGKLIVKFYGRPKNTNSKTLIKMQNYIVAKATGTINYACDSILVTTLSTSGNTKSFNVNIYNGVCTADNWTIKYSSSKTIAMNNNGTPLVFNDDYTTVNGTANGTNRTGRNFSVTTNGLTKPNNCKYITSGSLVLTPDGLSARTVDYGTGACDDDATYTVNGQTIAFKLK